MLAGCASVAHVEKDETVNLNNYKTFAWVKPAIQATRLKQKRSALTEQNVRKAVNEELGNEGWRGSEEQAGCIVKL